MPEMGVEKIADYVVAVAPFGVIKIDLGGNAVVGRGSRCELLYSFRYLGLGANRAGAAWCR